MKLTRSLKWRTLSPLAGEAEARRARESVSQVRAAQPWMPASWNQKTQQYRLINTVLYSTCNRTKVDCRGRLSDIFNRCSNATRTSHMTKVKLCQSSPLRSLHSRRESLKPLQSVRSLWELAQRRNCSSSKPHWPPRIASWFIAPPYCCGCCCTGACCC